MKNNYNHIFLKIEEINNDMTMLERQVALLFSKMDKMDYEFKKNKDSIGFMFNLINLLNKLTIKRMELTNEIKKINTKNGQ